MMQTLKLNRQKFEQAAKALQFTKGNFFLAVEDSHIKLFSGSSKTYEIPIEDKAPQSKSRGRQLYELFLKGLGAQERPEDNFIHHPDMPADMHWDTMHAYQQAFWNLFAERIQKELV